MLVQVSVRNFRNFNDWFHIDLNSNKNYEFNSFAVSNGAVSHGIIYGQNGSGKSNLGLAILDITGHLNDTSPSNTITGLKSNYLNANSYDTGEPNIAEFKYRFRLEGVELQYNYGKSDFITTVYEELIIDQQTYIKIDRRKSDIATFAFKGTENLKTDFSNTKISALKYLTANAILDETKEAKVFNKLIEFVNGMVFFRTLNKRSEHHGIEVGVQRLSQEIIKGGHLTDFEQFLNEAGVACKLVKIGTNGDERIDFSFKGKTIEFSLAASSGTQSLGVFYFWWLKLKKNELTFAYIDEFDAFYHFTLAKEIVRKLSELPCQWLLTTHNTGIMSNDLLRPDCYFEVKEESFKPFFSLVNKEIRKAHNLEKMYKGLNNKNLRDE